MLITKDVAMYVYNETMSLCRNDKETIAMLDKYMADCTGLNNFILSIFAYDSKEKRVKFIRSSLKSKVFRARILFFFNTRFSKARRTALKLLADIKFDMYMGRDNVDEINDYYDAEYDIMVKAYKKSVSYFNVGVMNLIDKYENKTVPVTFIIEDPSPYIPVNDYLLIRNDTAIEEYKKEPTITNEYDKLPPVDNTTIKRNIQPKIDDDNSAEIEYVNAHGKTQKLRYDHGENINNNDDDEDDDNNNSAEIEYVDAYGKTQKLRYDHGENIYDLYYKANNALDESYEKYENDMAYKSKQHKEETEKFQKEVDNIIEQYKQDFRSATNTIDNNDDEEESSDAIETRYTFNDDDNDLMSEEEFNRQIEESEHANTQSPEALIAQASKAAEERRKAMEEAKDNNQNIDLDEMSAADIHNRNL